MGAGKSQRLGLWIIGVGELNRESTLLSHLEVFASSLRIQTFWNDHLTRQAHFCDGALSASLSLDLASLQCQVLDLEFPQGT